MSRITYQVKNPWEMLDALFKHSRKVVRGEATINFGAEGGSRQDCTQQLKRNLGETQNEDDNHSSVVWIGDGEKCCSFGAP